MLIRSVRECMGAAGWTAGSAGSASSRVATDRHESVAEHKAGKSRKTCLKCHVTTTLGLRMLLEVSVTTSSIHDTKM